MIQCSITKINSNIPGEDGVVTDFFSFVEKTWDLILNRLLDEHLVKIPKKIHPIYETDAYGNDIQVGFCVQHWGESNSKTGKCSWEQKWISFHQLEIKHIKMHESLIPKRQLAQTKELVEI
jgi:hypothetical protein